MALETLFFNKARCFAVFQEEDVSVGKRDKIANKEGRERSLDQVVEEKKELCVNAQNCEPQKNEQKIQSD